MAVKKKGLGRGLDALFPEKSVKPAEKKPEQKSVATNESLHQQEEGSLNASAVKSAAETKGAEQGDLLSAQRALQSGEHGLHFVLLQLLGAHGGAAEGHDTKFRKPGGRELPRGQHGDLRTGLPGAVCDAVGHGLRVAGTAPVYDG